MAKKTYVIKEEDYEVAVVRYKHALNKATAEIDNILDDITRNAAAQGMEFEDFLKANGETVESWEKEARKVAEMRVKGSLALQTLAVENKITVSDEEVAAKIAELKDVYKKTPEALKSLKDPNVKMDIKNRLIIEKTLDYLVKVNSK